MIFNFAVKILTDVNFIMVENTFTYLLTYLLTEHIFAVRYRYNKKFVIKKQQISLIFWHSLPILISLHEYFAGKIKVKKAKVELNCDLCVVNNFYTHLATKHAS